MTASSKRYAVAAGALAVVLGLGGCVTVPTGPAVMVLPGQYKPFDQFRADDLDCRSYAAAAVGGTAQQATDSATATAVGGTLLGAAVGAAIGAASGQAGPGAAIGAGSGLLFGGLAGSGQAGGSSYALQQRYDGAYMQCMYAKGNQIPVRAGNSVVYGNPPVTSYGPPPAGSQTPPAGGSQLPPPPPRSQ